MRYSRFAIVPAAIAFCGFVSACSYHKTVDKTQPVVEAAPAPAPAPAMSSSTTTTTTSDNGMVEKQKTSTYSTP